MTLLMAPPIPLLLLLLTMRRRLLMGLLLTGLQFRRCWCRSARTSSQSLLIQHQHVLRLDKDFAVKALRHVIVLGTGRGRLGHPYRDTHVMFSVQSL